MLDFSAHKMVALPASSLGPLRDAVGRGGDGDTAPLQAAGFATGEGLYDAFSAWLAARGLPAADALDVDAAQAEASAFFRETGWGDVSFAQVGAAIALDSEAWVEADAASGLAHPGCAMSTAMLSGFFGRLADAPLAALEVECRSAGAPRCRFLLGDADALDGAYDALARGGDYAAALSG